MALLEIVKYGEPVLETPGEPVTEFDAKLKRLVSDMFETMYAARGVGLAAPQVGVSKRLFVMDCSGGGDPEARGRGGQRDGRPAPLNRALVGENRL